MKQHTVKLSEEAFNHIRSIKSENCLTYNQIILSLKSSFKSSKNKCNNYNIAKQHRIQVTLSEELIDSLEEKAKKTGFSKSKIIALSLNGKHPDNEKVLSDILNEISSLVYNLRRLGINLNQISRKLNQGILIDPDSLYSFLKEIEAIKLSIDELKNDLQKDTSRTVRPKKKAFSK